MRRLDVQSAATGLFSTPGRGPVPCTASLRRGSASSVICYSFGCASWERLRSAEMLLCFKSAPWWMATVVTSLVPPSGADLVYPNLDFWI